MRKYILLLWTSFLSACFPFTVERNCGPYADDGRAWAQAQKEGTEEAYRQYLAQYPDGCFVTEAAEKLKKPLPAKKIKKVTGGTIAPSGSY